MEFHKIKGVLWLQIFSGKIMYVYFDFQNKKISFQRPPVKLIHCLKVWKLHPIMRSMLLKIQKNNLLQISKCTCTLSQHISWREITPNTRLLLRDSIWNTLYTNDLPDDCLLILLYSKLNVQKVLYTTNYFTRDSNNNIVTIFQLNLVFHNLNNAVSWNQKSFRSRTHCIYLYYLIAINSCHNQCVRTKIRSDDKKILH